MTPLETLVELLRKKDQAQREADEFDVVVEEIREDQRKLQDRAHRARVELHAHLDKLAAGDVEVS